MLILIPPSEGKAQPPTRGHRVDLPDLAYPELAWARRRLMAALAEASVRPDALELLKVGTSVLADVRANVDLARTPTRPASEIYTGVLYAALDYPTLSPDCRRRATRRIRVQSALWGPIRLNDRIPPYRLSIGATLPGIGPLAAFWRERMAAVSAPVGPVVDCRSTGYAAAWRMRREVDTVAVRVVSEVDGRLTVISHQAKHTRGLVARQLLEPSRPAQNVDQVAAMVADGGFDCELVRERHGWRLDVRAVEPEPVAARSGRPRG